MKLQIFTRCGSYSSLAFCHFVFVATCQLFEHVLREKFETTSKKLGELAKGDRLTVHDVIGHIGGITRARVMVDSGMMRGREGFVTYDKKDGSCSLHEVKGVVAFTKALPQQALDAARAAFEVFDGKDIVQH